MSVHAKDEGSRRSQRRLTRRALLGIGMLGAAQAAIAGAALWRWLDDLRRPPGAIFTREPYLTAVTEREAEVRWLTREGQAVEITAVAEGSDAAVLAADGRFTGLEPGTRYAWTARSVGRTVAEGSFTTAPASLDAPITFAVFGDYGDGGEHERNVGRVALDQDPRFVVTTGDNSYIVAAASLLDRNIFQPLAPLLASAPMVLCMGDHDEFWPGPGALLGAFGQARRQDVRYGPVQIVVCGDRIEGEEGLAFVRTALADPGPRVRFVVQHRPMQPGQALARVAREGGAVAVFAGHLHRYERRVVDGMLQFTVGTGGKGPGSMEGTPRSRDAVVSLLDYGHLRVDVRPDGSVGFRFLDEHGAVLDEHEVAAA